MLELANNQIKSQETEKEPLKIGVCVSRKELVGTQHQLTFVSFWLLCWKEQMILEIRGGH